MTAAEIVGYLTTRGHTVELREGGSLRVRPRLPANLAERLSAHKAEVVEYLRDLRGAMCPVSTATSPPATPHPYVAVDTVESVALVSAQAVVLAEATAAITGTREQCVVSEESEESEESPRRAEVGRLKPEVVAELLRRQQPEDGAALRRHADKVLRTDPDGWESPPARLPRPDLTVREMIGRARHLYECGFSDDRTTCRCDWVVAAPPPADSPATYDRLGDDGRSVRGKACRRCRTVESCYPDGDRWVCEDCRDLDDHAFVAARATPAAERRRACCIACGLPWERHGRPAFSEWSLVDDAEVDLVPLRRATRDPQTTHEFDDLDDALAALRES
jgi:hypothetical protein